MKSGPKEDPEDKKARMLERRQSLLERRNAAEQNAGGLTNDLRAVYGIQSLFNFGRTGTKPKTSTVRAMPQQTPITDSPNR